MRIKAWQILIFFSILSIAAAARVQIMPFQGDAAQAGVPINNGNLNVSIYSTPTGGSPFFSEAFPNSINSGRFDVVLGNTSTDLILNFSQIYYVDFEVNGVTIPTARQPFMNGMARGLFVDSTNQVVYVNGSLVVNNETLGISQVNVTAISYDGDLTFGGLSGYKAANAICENSFPLSRMCTPDDIMFIIASQDITYFGSLGTAWVSEGPPGYTANANDCNGWTTNSNTFLGAFWVFNATTGGAGYLVNCQSTKPLACCS